MRLLAATLLLAMPLTLAAAEYSDRERSFWSFQQRQAAVPPVADSDWVSSPVDAFVWNRLAAAGLRPAPEARRVALARRAYFDATGLPPTPAELEAFVSDRSPDAWERLVDRLMSSPRWGERAAQRWLDVVRFAETEGFEYDRYLPGLWRYRDYVIESFNRDKPLDRFIAEQLAGDEMAAVGPQSQADREMLAAAGFHRLGPVRRNAGNQEVASSRNEVLTERTDIVGTALLGLTVGCARCHDHMFDPIRQVDYYRLQAYFGASREANLVFDSDSTIEEWQKATKEIATKMKSLRGEIKLAEGEQRLRLQAEHDALESQLPEPPPTLATVQNGSEDRNQVRLLDRGDHTKPLQPVDPRPLGVLLPEDAPTLPPDVENPRSRLAGWITSPGHPLTARVAVNRIWQGYFGRGIVDTPNDFGAMGGRPSHPALLDYLANELVESGWSVKHVHRLILTSSAYRQASHNPAQEERGMQQDASNRLLWRGPRRRLGAEEVRDAMLAAAGEINLAYGGKSVMLPVEDALVDLLYDPTQWRVPADPAQHRRRSIYLLAKRNLRLPFMEVFDQPALLTSCARRESSTHAPQSLELLNGSISNELAARFAARLDREAGRDLDSIVNQAYLLAAGRPPTDDEALIARNFLADNSLREFALAMFNLNSFLYLN
ncbi:MAG: DUF1549 and DUF1553 domain-containing protein [Bryobacterales bacterium]|nr:DUF1549 and DUF1553 domain-containing protein [Bryobacterales bacterium]MDE0624529.1 DUF1549 and DUF1553 domain-containing protein [Bryobacterales bacterium]